MSAKLSSISKTIEFLYQEIQINDPIKAKAKVSPQYVTLLFGLPLVNQHLNAPNEPQHILPSS